MKTNPLCNDLNFIPEVSEGQSTSILTYPNLTLTKLDPNSMTKKSNHNPITDSNQAKGSLQMKKKYRILQGLRVAQAAVTERWP